MRSSFFVHYSAENVACLRSPPSSGLKAPLLQGEEIEISDDAMCRICHSTASELGDGCTLLTPCWCLGSLHNICRQCLDTSRSSKTKIDSVRCSLCGFAYLYEYKPAGIQARLKTICRCVSSKVSLLFLAACSKLAWLHSFGVPAFLIGVLLVGLVLDAMKDLWHVCHRFPPYGSLAYSWKRLRCIKTQERELWEVHKAEWQRADIVPYDENCDLIASSSSRSLVREQCRVALEVVLLYMGVLFFITTIAMPPPIYVDALTRLEEKLDLKVLCLSLLVYDALAVLLHSVSFLAVAHVELLRNEADQLIVRSLSKQETRRSVSGLEGSVL